MPRPERQLIERVRRLAKGLSPQPVSLVTGIGDDCAVLRPPAGHDLLVTTDFSLEGVHFRRDWHPPESVGHRCLTRGLSDIAAMGGVPMAVFLSLALTEDVPQKWVDGFYSGLGKLASRHHVALAGGDTAQSSSGVLADIMVVGSVPRGNAVLRSGAKPGDRLYVTGRLGESAAEIRRRYAGGAGLSGLHKRAPNKKGASAPEDRFLYPEPRLTVGQKLRGVASAMIDISDGLSTDLSHICEESGMGAVIYEASIPVSPTAELNDALYGGDDYELLFTSSKRVPKEMAGVAISEIGEIVGRKGMWIQNQGGMSKRLKAGGWQHFA